MSDSKKTSPMKILLAFLVICAVLLGILFFDYKNSLDKPISNSTEKVDFQIKQGDGVNGILHNLIEKELIKKRSFYYSKIYLKLNKLEGKLQAGNYSIPRNLNIKELMETLQKAKEQDFWVTIPEGLRKDEVAVIIAKELEKSEKASFSIDDFLKATTNPDFIATLNLPAEVKDLEGFLYPDKYAFASDSTTESVLKILVETFHKKVIKDYTYKDIIMASIVEREGFNSEDRPIIAGILQKRIREGWLLQADATLLYPLKDWKYEITYQDLEKDNPYNSYKRIGLPPTPICNPSVQAIEATLSPKESPYYFYIHGKDGVARYAKTLAEHHANIKNYLR